MRTAGAGVPAGGRDGRLELMCVTGLPGWAGHAVPLATVRAPPTARRLRGWPKVTRGGESVQPG